MRRALTLLVGLAGLGWLVACGGLGGGPFPTGLNVVIGLPASLSGRHAPIGQGAVNALQLYETWVNQQGGIWVADQGRRVPVRIVVADDRSDPSTAATVYQQLVTTQAARFMMASYSSALALAQAPQAEQRGILTFCWGSSADEIWQQGYRQMVGVLTPASTYNDRLLELLARQTPVPRRIALLYQDDPYARAVAAGTTARAAALGLTVVHSAVYPAEPADLSPFLLAAQAANADALLVEGHLADALLAAQQRVDFGIRSSLASFGSAAAASGWAASLGAAAQHTVGVSQWEASLPLAEETFRDARWFGPRWTPAEWRNQYVARFGAEPDYRAVACFAAALALQQAIERANTLRTDRVRAKLLNLDQLSTFGRFRLDATMNQAGHETVVVQWQNGAKQVVWPAAQQTAPLIYPLP